MSRPLQIYLEDSEFDALELWTKRRGWTLSQAVRAALRALTRSAGEIDPLLAASGMIDGLPSDLSQRFDDYLGMTFVAEPSITYGRKPRKARARKGLHR